MGGKGMTFKNYRARRLVYYFTIRIMLRTIPFSLYFACGLNPRKLYLEKATRDFDTAYYDYYGSSVDSFTDLFFEQDENLLKIKPYDYNAKYCWSCNSRDISNCRERGTLQKCNQGEICQLSVNRKRNTPQAEFLITNIKMGCAAEQECREKMYANFKYGGNKCEPDKQRQATCTQCCYKTNCFTSQGYVE